MLRNSILNAGSAFIGQTFESPLIAVCVQISHCLNSVNCVDEESLGTCTVRFEAAEPSYMWLLRWACGLLGNKSRVIQPGALWLGPGL